ncbi:hypothetical protein Dacet_0526 [Denitrovibrio acetiphilus DSM 12809]|uniref:Uncharacterized protein n=1 Tax=Denitrovibrio acetiphilus (strain DSM 12809 / NBRC 114555 / N2460) TaxID=522772 RepID=D4H413_DENA2|nr:hypothetical protein [Denitrovibrio acetiphilus]ADD67324.1 hypothetical protein Dacet_0526 [Denitrovibrio acetiphilus DSM 12809]
MGKTIDIADNLVKMAHSLKYDDFDAKDKILQYAGKLIGDEFGESSIYMQKLGLIVFSPKDGAVLGSMGAGEEHLKKAVFTSGAERLVELLEQVRDAIGGIPSDSDKVVVIQAKDKIAASRIVSHIKAKGYEPVLIKDTDDWKSKIDELLP